jgi:hypothetical protein
MDKALIDHYDAFAKSEERPFGSPAEMSAIAKQYAEQVELEQSKAAAQEAALQQKFRALTKKLAEQAELEQLKAAAAEAKVVTENFASAIRKQFAQQEQKQLEQLLADAMGLSPAAAQKPRPPAKADPPASTIGGGAAARRFAFD